jgi:hypothetical protein
MTIRRVPVIRIPVIATAFGRRKPVTLPVTCPVTLARDLAHDLARDLETPHV